MRREFNLTRHRWRRVLTRVTMAVLVLVPSWNPDLRVASASDSGLLVYSGFLEARDTETGELVRSYSPFRFYIDTFPMLSGAFGLSVDGSKAYLGTDEGQGTVYVLDLLAGVVVKEIRMPGSRGRTEFLTSPDGNQMYVNSATGGSAFAIDTRSDSSITTLRFDLRSSSGSVDDDSGFDLTLSEDAETLYVLRELTEDGTRLDGTRYKKGCYLSTFDVSGLDTPNTRISRSVPVSVDFPATIADDPTYSGQLDPFNYGCEGLRLSADGSTAYLVRSKSSFTYDPVTETFVVDTSTEKISVDLATGLISVLSGAIEDQDLLEAPPKYLRPPPPGSGYSISDASVSEGNSGTSRLARFVVTRSGSLVNAGQVSFSTESGTSGSRAIQDKDFKKLDTLIEFPAGVGSAQVTVKVIGDTVKEPTEKFRAVLSNPTFGLVTRNVGLGTIVNDD